MKFPLEPITILIIGPSQNGKSTFINRLIKLSVSKVPFVREGDGNFKCTTNCNIVDLEIPLTEYFLRDLTSKQAYDVPDITDEEAILGGSWYRKQTTAKYSIEPYDKRAPCVKVRVIDTPGLDDNEGKDFENMSDVLSTLNQLAKSPREWERKVHAVVLVYNAESAFSYTFQGIIKDYHRCMPNLFGGLSVINTHFSVAALSSKRQHLIRDKILGTGESARSRVLRARGEDFKKIFGENMAPTHFFIDNKPRDRLVYEELLSRNTIFDVLSFWMTAKPMPICQMRLIKTELMRAIDQKLALYLQKAMDEWNKQLKVVRRTASERDVLRSTLLQRKKELEDTTSRLQSDLERLDNDTEFSLRTYTTQDDPGVWELVGKWLVRSRIHNTMKITESEYPEFDVIAQDATRAKWVSKSYNPSTRTWTGAYEGEPGKVPNLVARSHTTNRVKYRHRISELNSDLRRAKANLAENEVQWDDFAARGGDASSTGNSDMDKLVHLVEAANNLSQILTQPSPPVDKAFDEASKIRYGKISTREVGHGDLFAFVKLAEPDLLKPLQAALIVLD